MPSPPFPLSFSRFPSHSTRPVYFFVASSKSGVEVEVGPTLHFIFIASSFPFLLITSSVPCIKSLINSSFPHMQCFPTNSKIGVPKKNRNRDLKTPPPCRSSGRISIPGVFGTKTKHTKTKNRCAKINHTRFAFACHDFRKSLRTKQLNSKKNSKEVVVVVVIIIREMGETGIM